MRNVRPDYSLFAANIDTPAGPINNRVDGVVREYTRVGRITLGRGGRATGSHTKMIAQLRGTLTEKRPNQVIVDVGGVGYLVNISLSTFYALAELHQEVSLLIHTHVREDSLALYGFITAREKHLFESLLSVSGVGPTLAIKILSGMSADDLVPAIRQGDLLRLTRIPGVGRKTAERMVVELRDRLAVMAEAEGSAPHSRPEAEAQVKSVVVDLGYEPRAVEGVLEKLGASATADFDTLLRDVLQTLGSRVMQKKKRTRPVT